MGSSSLVFITGVPSTGKTTLARKLNGFLRNSGLFSVHLDGFDLRKIFGNFEYTPDGILKLAESAGNLLEILCEKEVHVILSAVVPLERARSRMLSSCERSILVLLECGDEEILRSRSKRYEMADEGRMVLPGYTIPFERPSEPDLVLDTCLEDEDLCLKKILDLLRARGVM